MNKYKRKNYQNFIFKAFSIKTDKNFKKDRHFLLTISDFNKHKDDIKVDYTIDYANIFDEDKFVLELKKLYSKLNYDDFNINNIKTFYKEYISLHNFRIVLHVNNDFLKYENLFVCMYCNNIRTYPSDDSRILYIIS